MTDHESGPTGQGEASYEKWRAGLASKSEYQVIDQEEEARSELWLQLTEARDAACITQTDVAKGVSVSGDAMMLDRI